MLPSHNLICWFCGKKLDYIGRYAGFKCYPCHVGYIIWDYDDPNQTPDCSSVYFIKDEYAVVLRLNEWRVDKTSLVYNISIDGQDSKVKILLDLPYYVDINPFNKEYWIERLKGMVIFS